MIEPLILDSLVTLARKAAREAGEKILEVYHSADFEVETKEDQSPLTLADRLAHECIIKHLRLTDLPILSEEGRDIPYLERKDWEYFWMVDPLDGTKEFIKKNGEFTVNIALIYQGEVILGVVYCPVLDKLYYARQGEGAYLSINKTSTQIQTSAGKHTALTRVVASRSHMNEETEAFISQYPQVELLNMGSSLKFMLVAEGKADVYPRMAPTMEWDTAAAQIIVEEAGGSVVQYETQEKMRYNKENLLNPYFVVYNSR